MSITNNPLILDQILSHLAPEDIKTAALVSSTWSSQVEVPKFWSWVRLTLTSENFSSVFTSRRFQSISDVHLCDKKKLSKSQLNMFYSSLNRSPIKKLYSSWISLYYVNPTSLAQLMVRLEEVVMVDTELPSEQVNAVFKALSECEDLKLKYLNICVNNISPVPPSVLSWAVIRLEKAILSYTRLTGPQVENLLDTIIQARARGDLKLKSLNIRRADVSTVSASVTQRVKSILLLFIYQ